MRIDNRAIRAMVQQSEKPADVQMAEEMTRNGITPPAAIEMDGRIHRFPTNEQRGDDAGWYVAYGDNLPSWSYGDFRTGATYTGHVQVLREISPEESVRIAARTEEAIAIRKAAEEARKSAVAKACAEVWDCLKACDGHPYLERKHVGSHGARIGDDGWLYLPVYSCATGRICSLQRFAPTCEEGGKWQRRFASGGSMEDGYWWVGDLSDPKGTLYFAEGFATAASISEATGCPCVITYMVSHMRRIASWFSDMWQGRMVMVADNDESQVGQTKAREAADASGADCIVVPDAGSDANDYAVAHGPEALKELLAPKEHFFRDVDLETAPQVDYLIDDVLPEEALAMMHGPSGNGKTFVAIDWMLSLATGQPQWFGHRIFRQCRVYYACGEDAVGVRKRVKAWTMSRGLDSPGWFRMAEDSVDFDTPEGFRTVVGGIEDWGERPDVVCFDTLNCYFAGDENSSQEARAFINNCKKLLEAYRCTVLIIHHTAKNPDMIDEARGSTAWKGAMTVEYSVVQDKERTVTIKQMKLKGDELHGPEYARIEGVDLPWRRKNGDLMTAGILVQCEAPMSETVRKYLDAFEDACVSCGKTVLTQQDLLSWMDDQEWSRDMKKKAFQKDTPSRMMACLTFAGVVGEEDDGWHLRHDLLAVNARIQGGKNAQQD